MSEAKTGSTRWARVRGGIARAAVATLVLASVAPATALAQSAGASRLTFDVASTLATGAGTVVDATAPQALAPAGAAGGTVSGVVLAGALADQPLQTGLRASYTVHRYLQTTSGGRYVEQTDAVWPVQLEGVSGAPIPLQASDDPQAARAEVLGEPVEGYESFVADGNAYVTGGPLPVAADGTVARPAANLQSAAPVVSADGSHVHLFYDRASYPLRVVAGRGVSSVAVSGSGQTAEDELTVSVGYGRPLAVLATLEGGYERVEWTVENGGIELAPGTGATAVLPSMPAGGVTLVAQASRAEYDVRLMGEGQIYWEDSELDGTALADDRLAGVYTYRTGTDLVLPALRPRAGRTLVGWAVSGHVEGAEPRVERRSQTVDGQEVPYWVFVGESSFGDVELTAMWDSQWKTLALQPAPTGVELSTVDGVASGALRSVAVLSGVGVYRSDETSLESARIDDQSNPGNWISGAELPRRAYTVAYDPAGGTIAGHQPGEVVEDSHEIRFVGYEGGVVKDGVRSRQLLIAAESAASGTVGRVTEAFDVSAQAGGDTVLTGVWNEAEDAFALPAVERVGYAFAGWYENGVRRDLRAATLVPTKVRTELVARWSPVTYRVTYGNLDGELLGDAASHGGARLALAAAGNVPGGGTGGHTTYTVQSASWMLPEPSSAEAPAGYEFAGYILDVEDGALDERLSSPTGVVLSPVTHDSEGRHGGAVIGSASHANVRATATWRPKGYAVTLAAAGATTAARAQVVYGQYGSGELYLERAVGVGSPEAPLAVEPLSGKVLDVPVREYRVAYAAGAEAGVEGVPGVATVEREFTGYWYTGADGVARRVIKVERQEDGTPVGVLDDAVWDDVPEGQPASAAELVASWSANVTLEGRWAEGGSVALPAPKREGWAFDGWLLSGEGVETRVLAGGEDASFELTGAASELTLTAQWSSGEFTIEYDVPADAVLGAALPSRYSGEQPFDLPQPSRPGWRFVGWYGGLSEQRDEYSADSAARELTVDGPLGDLWLGTSWEPVRYSVWLAMPASETSLLGGTAKGWKAVSGDVRAELAAPAGRGVLDVAAGESALSEVLEAATAGGDSRLGTLAEASKFVTAWSHEYTVNGGALKLPVPVKAGYTFAGWVLRLADVVDGKPTADAGAGWLAVRGAGAEECVIESGSWGNVVAMPTWHRNTYRVSFSAGAPLGAEEAVFAGVDGFAAHGSLAMESSAFVASYDTGYELPESLYERQHSVSFDANVPASEEATVISPDAVTGTWDFAGWRLPDGSVHAAGEMVRNLAASGSAEVVATWTPSGKVTLPAGPQRAGWLFAGWSESKNAKADGSNGAILSAGSEYAPQSNVTLHAVWQRGYHVIYDLGLGGTAEGVTEWVMPGTDEPVVPADAERFVREGGWPNPSDISASELSDGGAVTLFSPVLEGWRFLGWFEDGVDLGGVDEPAVLTDATDHVLRARWERVTGTIIIKVRDYLDTEAMVHYSADLVDGSEAHMCLLTLDANLGSADYDSATETFTSKPISVVAGDYDFIIGDSNGRKYVGDESKLDIETVSVAEGEVVEVEFSQATTSKLYEAALSVMAEGEGIEISADADHGKEWLYVMYGDTKIGLMAYKVQDTLDTSKPYLMRYTRQSPEDLTGGFATAGSIAANAVQVNERSATE